MKDGDDLNLRHLRGMHALNAAYHMSRCQSAIDFIICGLMPYIYHMSQHIIKVAKSLFCQCSSVP